MAFLYRQLSWLTIHRIKTFFKNIEPYFNKYVDNYIIEISILQKLRQEEKICLKNF